MAAFPRRAGGGVCPSREEEADPADAGVVCHHPRPCALHPGYWSCDLADRRVGSVLYFCIPR